MEKTESRIEYRKKQKKQITTDFEILDWINIEKEDKWKIEWPIAVACTINKICAGEIPQDTPQTQPFWHHHGLPFRELQIPEPFHLAWHGRSCWITSKVLSSSLKKKTSVSLKLSLLDILIVFFVSANHEFSQIALLASYL